MSHYFHSDHLQRFTEIAEGGQELADKFFAYYASVFQDGALTAREKALIALAVSHAIQCPYCIEAYSQASQEQGADLDQMTEAVHVACAIRGGASLVYGLQMMDHVRKAGM
ncbi:MAG: 4-carboxymuconolactone decarboxylase [Candidatus Eisenbacteria bacterium]|nr:4-carboxymuconolactone decarboxylase [Candidatus Eisenbacteria bacterium]